jgi:hypothetical protein
MNASERRLANRVYAECVLFRWLLRAASGARPGYVSGRCGRGSFSESDLLANSSDRRSLTRAAQVRSTSHRAHGVVVSHPLSMREALGSIPSVSNLQTYMHSCEVARFLPDISN